MLIMLALMAGLTCPAGTAIVDPTQPPSTENCHWVPAENGQGCGPTAHRHALDLKENGKFVVNHQKGEPDIVFDGECHDNDKEFVCTPETTSKGVSTCVDSSRKVLRP
jgi:hypothetical protein